jgi:hypothetical protein
VKLPAAAAGQSVRLRWRLGTDPTGPNNPAFLPFWAIDSVSLNGVSCASVPQNVPWGLHTDIHGNDVTLAWAQPLSGPAAPYVLEVSVDGGSTFPLSFPAGAATAFQGTGPDGVFVGRVRGVQAGAVTEPSAPVTIPLGSTLAPPKPRNVIVTTNGNALNIAWSLDETGGKSNSVLLEAGNAPGVANIGTLPLPPGTTSFSASGVGNGTYFVRLRQQGPSLASAPSHEISFTLPGACAAPAVPPNLTATRIGTNGVLVSWDLGGVGTAAPSSWVLEAGTAPGAANIGVVPLPQRFILAPGVGAGTYFVRVYALNSCGASPRTADVSITIP